MNEVDKVTMYCMLFLATFYLGGGACLIVNHRYLSCEIESLHAVFIILSIVFYLIAFILWRLSKIDINTD